MSSKHETLASGHTSQEISGDEFERQSRDFLGNKRGGLIRLSPGGWYLPRKYLKFADEIYNFEFRSSDVVVMTYPKMGTTWTQEIVWTMKNNPHLNHPMGNVPTMAKSPFLDMDMLLGEEILDPALENFAIMKAFRQICPGSNPNDGIMLQITRNMPDPRVVKVHLPFSLFQKELIDTCKTIYVVRNPKDGVVSYHHHSRLLKVHDYVGSFDQFVQYFVDDELLYGPYWEHIKEAWNLRDHPNVLFLFYEDMKKDIEAEVRKIDQFIGTKLTDEQIQNVINHTKFDNMKNLDTETSASKDPSGSPGAAAFMNKEVLDRDGGFFRQGKSGQWKEKLTSAQEAKIDLWTKKNTLGMGIKFKYN